jgi:ubiquinone/menaquinone biosynthesis C-methylase UbiE
MKQALYRDLAHYYDLIYSWKKYEKECAELKRLIKKFKQSSGNKLLDVGCGTGKHLQYFRKEFICAGSDVNPGVLRETKKRFPTMKFTAADMTSLPMKGEFDVITCLFSSIGYVKSEAGVRKSIRSFAKALKPGGIVIIEPWIARDEYRIGSPHMTTYDGKDIKIARLVVSRVEGKHSIMDMNFLIAERGKPVRHFVDKHEMLLADNKMALRFMDEAGLAAMFIRKGISDRGLLVGVKPLA